MSADFHIHVYKGLTKRDLELFFCNHMGSKYFNLDLYPDRETSNKLYDKMLKTPNIFIGEVSWLKAAMFEDDSETFIPSPVETINNLIGEELPRLNKKLITDILNAFNQKNITCYRVNNVEKVKEFLKNHYGERVFTITW